MLSNFKITQVIYSSSAFYDIVALKCSWEVFICRFLSEDKNNYKISDEKTYDIFILVMPSNDEFVDFNVEEIANCRKLRKFFELGYRILRLLFFIF